METNFCVTYRCSLHGRVRWTDSLTMSSVFCSMTTSANQPSPGQLWPGLASSSIPPGTPNKVPNWPALSMLLQAGSGWPNSAQSGKAVIWLSLFNDNSHSEEIGQTAPLQPSLGKLHSASHSGETGQTMPDYSRKQGLYPNATTDKQYHSKYR